MLINYMTKFFVVMENCRQFFKEKNNNAKVFEGNEWDVICLISTEIAGARIRD